MARITITENELRNLIGRSIENALSRKMLREEAEPGNNKIVDLISFLHNAQLPVREIHWNTRNNALHLLTDEAIDELLDWEDRLAETYLGGNGGELKINGTSPTTTEFEGIMNDLIKWANDVRESIGDNKDFDNVNAIIDEILETANKNLYRADFK